MTLLDLEIPQQLLEAHLGCVRIQDFHQLVLRISTFVMLEL